MKRLADAYDAVCVESLNMRSMSNRGFHNGKATLDNGYGMFLNMLEYKLADRGKYLVKVSKWYPIIGREPPESMPPQDALKGVRTLHKTDKASAETQRWLKQDTEGVHRKLGNSYPKVLRLPCQP